VALIHGDLRAEYYEEETARDPRIDGLRTRMELEEDPRYTAEYLDPKKRSIANAVQIFFEDGSCTDKVAVEYPIGHRRRRAEALPLLFDKLRENLAGRLPADRVDAVVTLFQDRRRLEQLTVPQLIEHFL
jgi:2-methylcitrate dehydratase